MNSGQKLAQMVKNKNTESKKGLSPNWGSESSDSESNREHELLLLSDSQSKCGVQMAHEHIRIKHHHKGRVTYLAICPAGSLFLWLLCYAI